MDIQKVLELRNDFHVTLRVLRDMRNPFSVGAIQEREDLEREIDAYRVSRAAFLERRRHERTAAARAAAEAEVARLRAALDKIIDGSEIATRRHDLLQIKDVLWRGEMNGWKAAAEIAWSALYPEATHENG